MSFFFSKMMSRRRRLIKAFILFFPDIGVQVVQAAEEGPSWYTNEREYVTLELAVLAFLILLAGAFEMVEEKLEELVDPHQLTEREEEREMDRQNARDEVKVDDQGKDVFFRRLFYRLKVELTVLGILAVLVWIARQLGAFK